MIKINCPYCDYVDELPDEGVSLDRITVGIREWKEHLASRHADKVIKRVLYLCRDDRESLAEYLLDNYAEDAFEHKKIVTTR